MKLLTLSVAIFAGMAAAANDANVNRLMQLKTNHWQSMRDNGMFDPGRYKSVSTTTACVNGKAGDYSCQNVDMHAFLSHQDMGSTTREGNDVWGKVSPFSVLRPPSSAGPNRTTNTTFRLDFTGWT
jgi:hypothetical protein